MLLEDVLRKPEGEAARVVLIHGGFPWHEQVAYLAAVGLGDERDPGRVFRQDRERSVRGAAVLYEEVERGIALPQRAVERGAHERGLIQARRDERDGRKASAHAGPSPFIGVGKRNRILRKLAARYA